jgi:ectoine hydroxylase-related dioxygenase (phytanoyl-CoA dioxygenase family)
MNTVLFWLPLQAVTEINGCMRYEAGSHRRGLLPHYRYDPADPYTLITDHVQADRVVACPMEAGGAVLHLPLTLHSAYPNATPHVRRVWALLFRPLGKFGFLAPSRLLQQAKLLRDAFR